MRYCLKIYDGESGTQLAKLCGKLANIDNYIQGESNSVRLVFTTNSNTQRPGWQLTWTSVHVGRWISILLLYVVAVSCLNIDKCAA